jgi:hypothetical protein
MGHAECIVGKNRFRHHSHIWHSEKGPQIYRWQSICTWATDIFPKTARSIQCTGLRKNWIVPTRNSDRKIRLVPVMKLFMGSIGRVNWLLVLHFCCPGPRDNQVEPLLRWASSCMLPLRQSPASIATGQLIHSLILNSCSSLLLLSIYHFSKCDNLPFSTSVRDNLCSSWSVFLEASMTLNLWVFPSLLLRFPFPEFETSRGLKTFR